MRPIQIGSLVKKWDTVFAIGLMKIDTLVWSNERRIASQSVEDSTVEKQRKISNSAEDGEDESGQPSFETEVVCQVSTTDSETQTESQFMDSYVKMTSEISLLRSENQRLLDCSFALKRQADVLNLTPDFLKSNEEKLKFYTGK